jgi:hypothetical protein
MTSSAIAELETPSRVACSDLFVARIVEKKIPVSVHTPMVNPVPYNKRRIEEGAYHPMTQHWLELFFWATCGQRRQSVAKEPMDGR